MPIRWVISPIVIDQGVRRPKVATLVDPGRPPTGVDDIGVLIPHTYKHSSVCGAVWCLSFVRGVDLSVLDADQQCIHVFEQDYEDSQGFLDQTPRSLGWTNARLNRIRDRLSSRGVDVTGLTADSPLWEIAQRLGRHLHGRFQPRGTWVR